MMRLHTNPLHLLTVRLAQEVTDALVCLGEAAWAEESKYGLWWCTKQSWQTPWTSQINAVSERWIVMFEPALKLYATHLQCDNRPMAFFCTLSILLTVLWSICIAFALYLTFIKSLLSCTVLSFMALLSCIALLLSYCPRIYLSFLCNCGNNKFTVFLWTRDNKTWNFMNQSWVS